MAGVDGFGVRLLREETPGAGDYMAIANISSLDGPGISREEIDVTAHDSPDQWEEIIFGIKRSGEVSIDVNWHPSQHSYLLDDFNSPDPRGYRIVWPDPDQTTWDFQAGLTGYEPSAPHDDKLEASVTFKLSGPPDFMGDES